MAEINLPIIFSQWDSRWDSILLGFSTKSNIHNFGCYLSCWAMVCRYYGKEVDPKTLNEKLKALGVGKGFNGDLYVPGGVHLLFGDIVEKRTVTPSALTDAQMAEIRQAIDDGFPVIIGIDYDPKDVDYDSHFVTVVGYSNSDENDLKIADPLGGKLHSLKDYLGWLKPSARKTIESYVVVSGPKPEVTPETIVVSKDHYQLFQKNHDKWHQIVNYLKSGADPNGTSFEEIKSIVAGIKSRQTDLETQLDSASKDLAVANTEINNRKDQVSRLEGQVLAEQKAKKSEIDALISSMPDVSKIRGEYEGRISDLLGQVDQAKKAEGEAKLELARCQGETAEVKGAIQKLVEWVISFIKK